MEVFYHSGLLKLHHSTELAFLVCCLGHGSVQQRWLHTIPSLSQVLWYRNEIPVTSPVFYESQNPEDFTPTATESTSAIQMAPARLD
jgi:hypothetical protein